MKTYLIHDGNFGNLFECFVIESWIIAHRYALGSRKATTTSPEKQASPSADPSRNEQDMLDLSAADTETTMSGSIDLGDVDANDADNSFGDNTPSVGHENVSQGINIRPAHVPASIFLESDDDITITQDGQGPRVGCVPFLSSPFLRKAAHKFLRRQNQMVD